MVRRRVFGRAAEAVEEDDDALRRAGRADEPHLVGALSVRALDVWGGRVLRAPAARESEDSQRRRRAPHRVTSRSTYFASTSTSRFTSSPGASPERVVSASVCGISAMVNASPPSDATVSETPSTVIEPFSTQ